jgi:uncharacterized repeat protein (TIGR03843 family)
VSGNGDAAWTELATHGAIEILGQMPWSSNATFLITLAGDGTEGRGIYKPLRGERPLADFPLGIYRREIAAYVLSAALDLDLIPVTIERVDAPFGVGSIQRFVEADFSEHYFTLIEDPAYAPALRRLAGFDLLLNNADRKGGHVLALGDGVIAGIDHGLCFHAHPKLRTVMWDFAGEPVPPDIAEAAASVTRQVPSALCELLEGPELDALRTRAIALHATPRFPFPDPRRRAHPWPLV